MVLIKVKWNKILFDNVELDLSQNVIKFKELILNLSGVPIDRQKIMGKGLWTGILKDDFNLSKLNIKEGTTLTLMGTADVVIKPTETIQFIEDLSATEKSQLGVDLVSSGLANLGNTCYLNSTIQCIRHMPEIRELLKQSETMQIEAHDAEALLPICRSLSLTFNKLDTSEVAITPIEFVFAIRRFFPQFSERASNGSFMQQDAEEFYNIVIQNLNNFSERIGVDFKKLLGIQLEEKLTCAETESEAPVVRYEFSSKLICVIQGGVTTTTNIDHLNDGLKLWTDGTTEKFSEILGRNALWNRKTRISRLPKHLCIQFMRFFWKETPDNADHRGLKCKILRPITFPEVLDIYDYVNEELQAALKLNREREDKLVHKLLSSGSNTSSANSMEVEDSGTNNDPELQNAIALSLGEPVETYVPPPWGDNLPANFTGLYEIESIVSHKGRSSDSGHYIGWVRQGPGSDLWWKYDDDKVSQVHTVDIMKLKGGGDHDMSYLAFYRYRDVQVLIPFKSEEDISK
mmetsp:Transcript_6317/g.5652  ORF Transcript_6317/g.5652 Transcript_6317/m.5652 type:complete len:517 (-) Transcript_6317:495-2045(-)